VTRSSERTSWPRSLAPRNVHLTPAETVDLLVAVEAVTPSHLTMLDVPGWVAVQKRLVGRVSGSRTPHHCILLAGSSVPRNSVVAAGATTAKPLPEPEKPDGGVPARVVSDLSGAHAFFGRTEIRLLSREDAWAQLHDGRRRHAEV
jgi:hypothetical protein